MHALGEFIQQQMNVRRWRQVDLVAASGLSKQVVSRLLTDAELHRMVEPATIAGLAHAFKIDPEVIRLKSAEAIGVRLGPVVLPAEDRPDEELLQILLERHLGRKLRGHQTAAAAAPNPQRVGNDAGEVMVSGEAGTSGDLRDPRRRTRDETHGERSAHQHAHPPLL